MGPFERRFTIWYKYTAVGTTAFYVLAYFGVLPPDRTYWYSAPLMFVIVLINLLLPALFAPGFRNKLGRK